MQSIFFQDKAFSLFHIRIYVHNLQQQLSSLENTISVSCVRRFFSFTSVSCIHNNHLFLRGCSSFSFVKLEKAKKSKNLKTNKKQTNSQTRLKEMCTIIVKYELTGIQKVYSRSSR